MMKSLFNPEKGTWVLFCFVAFFFVVVAVNSVFMYKALNTHSGVVTKQPYKKGLAYDELINTAKTQPDISQRAFFNDGVLKWVLSDKNGVPLSAKVSAHIVRNVRDGYDFNVILNETSPGIYETELNLPLKGQWTAQMKAQWNNVQYQTSLTFMTQ